MASATESTLTDLVKAVLLAPESAESSDLTIFAAEPWTPDSPAVSQLEDGPPPDGLKYFLEVDLAAEVLEVWSAWRKGRSPSLPEAVGAVIHYATFDAYQPVEDA